MTTAILLSVSVTFLALAVAWAAHYDAQKKITVLRWVDQREFHQRRIAVAVQQLRNLGIVEHVGQIDGIWSNRFGPNGPRTFAPSMRGMEQIALAMNILKEREGYYVQIRDEAKRAFEDLQRWEQNHPMPDIGIPYDEPPRPVKMPEAPKQHPKPAPRAFLDAPIYNKELTR